MKKKGIILVIIILIVLAIIILLIKNSNQSFIEVSPKEITYEEYVALSHDFENPYYNKISLNPQEKGVTLKMIEQKGVDISKIHRICLTAFYGTILPDESKFVFQTDSRDKDKVRYFNECDIIPTYEYDNYIFDVEKKELIPLPKNTIPIIWIDENNFLFWIATEKPRIPPSKIWGFFDDSYFNIYLYKINEKKYVKLSSNKFAYIGRSYLYQDFAISLSNDLIFIRDRKTTATENNFFNYYVLSLNEDMEEKKIEIKECKASANPYCGDFRWSKDGKSILYSHREDYKDFKNKTYRIIKIFD